VIRLQGFADYRHGGVTVRAWHQGSVVGLVQAMQSLRVRRCEDDLERLEQRVGRRLDKPYAVVRAAVDESLRGTGLGAAMYATLVELIGHNIPRAFLAAHTCVEGGTSPPARRVWASQRLAQDVVVEGLVATTASGVSRSTDSMPKIERTVDLGRAANSGSSVALFKLSLLPPPAHANTSR
jgi:GNAT superfamily N-acetyltransferase